MIQRKNIMRKQIRRTQPPAKTVRFIAKIKENVQIMAIDFVDSRLAGSSLARKKQMRLLGVAARNYVHVRYNDEKDFAKYAVFFKLI